MTDAEWFETLDPIEQLQIAQYLVQVRGWTDDPVSPADVCPPLPVPLLRRYENYQRVQEWWETLRGASR